jgi:hypothetical protein
MQALSGKLARLGRDFHLLWAGETVSHVGDRVTLVVVPAMMVFALGASAFEIGLVSMAQYVAIPVLSRRGALVIDDPRRPSSSAISVRRDRLIPIAYWQGFPSVPMLFICVAIVSAATVFFTVGYVPAVSSIVAPADLVRANARLEGSRTVAEVGGPGLAGWLYQALGAGALLVDAVSYQFRVRVGPSALRGQGRAGSGPGSGSDRLNWTDPVLRRSTAGTLLANIGGPIFVTQMPVLAYQACICHPGCSAR